MIHTHVINTIRIFQVMIQRALSKRGNCFVIFPQILSDTFSGDYYINSLKTKKTTELKIYDALLSKIDKL